MHLLDLFKKKIEEDQLLDLVDKYSEDMQLLEAEIVNMTRVQHGFCKMISQRDLPCLWWLRSWRVLWMLNLT